MSKVKNTFIACKRLTENGKTYKDTEGAFYLVDHDHPALAGKEFVNPNELASTIADYNRTNKANPFTGEVILINVITY